MPLIARKYFDHFAVICRNNSAVDKQQSSSTAKAVVKSAKQHDINFIRYTEYSFMLIR